MNASHLPSAFKDVLTCSISYKMTINRPAREVWPHMLNYREWNPDHLGASIERLAGEADSQGEMILEYKKTAAGYQEPILIETVRLVPPETVVWAIYDPKLGAANGIWFVDFTLTEVEGRTHFQYRLCGWIKSAPEALDPDKESVRRSLLNRLDEILPALKTYVEDRPPA